MTEDAEISRREYQKWSKLWWRNLAFNLPNVRRGIEKQYLAHPNKEAIVIGNGYSVHSELDNLRALKGKVILIAVDRVARLVPFADYVVTLDPQRVVASYLRGIDSKAFLVLGTFTHPEVARVWPGPLLWYHHWNPHLVKEFKPLTFAPAVGSMAIRGLVSLQAIEFASHLGVKTCYLVGSEFAYTDGMTAADGVDFRTLPQEHPIVANAQVVPELGIVTNHALLTASYLLQRMVEANPWWKKNLVNSTKGGLWKRWTDLSELVARY